MSLERADKTKTIPECPIKREILYRYYCRELIRLQERQQAIMELKTRLETYIKPPPT